MEIGEFSKGVFIYYVRTQGWGVRKLQFFLTLLCGSCHIRNVLIGVEYRNCCGHMDDYLHFAI